MEEKWKKEWKRGRKKGYGRERKKITFKVVKQKVRDLYISKINGMVNS
jgi:hypothetical protein